jgi:hypothetical protein
MDEQKARIRALLADRCRLKVHRETKMSPVYTLTVAKGGLKIQEVKGSGEPWEMLVTILSRRLGRPVVDKTGLTGTWQVKLEYMNDDGTVSGIGVGRIDPDAAAGRQWPSLITAMREQLGLSAEAAKGPVDTIVIDSVERPSGN